MEAEVRKVLLWLYQENPYLRIKYTLQSVPIFARRRVNSNFWGKPHQIQLTNTPGLHFFFLKQQPLAN